MRVLDGPELAKAILAMFHAKGDLRCAVAFWGPEMARRARERGATVILDLEMRGTTRNALTGLGVTPEPMPHGTGDRVRVLDRLHAKLYLGPDTAIICSANASGNALGRNGGEPRLWEAGILIRREKEPRAYGRAEDLWKRLLSASRPVRPDDLDRAPLVAATEAARDRGGNADAEPASILAAVVGRPERFATTTFVFGDHDIPTSDLKAVESDFEEAQGDTPQSQGRGLVCACSEDDEHDVLLRTAITVVMFWFGRQPGLYAYHDVVRTASNGRVSYFGRRRWPVVAPAVGLAGIGKNEVWASDRQAAERLCDIDGEPTKERYVARSAQATAAWLERHELL